MERIICLAIGYICGLLQTGYLVGKMNHVDIRKEGSGNAGSTNALRVMGWKAGAMTFAGDVIKCLAAVLIARYIYRDTEYVPLLAMYAGMGATLGHNFPFYLKFKGGKGIAVLAGLVLVRDGADPADRVFDRGPFDTVCISGVASGLLHVFPGGAVLRATGRL